MKMPAAPIQRLKGLDKKASDTPAF